MKTAALVMFACRIGEHRRENGRGDLKMATFLGFLHFQQLDWK
jgi:hypothetical protein